MNEDLKKIFSALSLKDGDVIFVDGDAVDVRSLCESDWVAKYDVLFVPVCVPPGKTVRDVIYGLSRTDNALPSAADLDIVENEKITAERTNHATR